MAYIMKDKARHARLVVDEDKDRWATTKRVLSIYAIGDIKDG